MIASGYQINESIERKRGESLILGLAKVGIFSVISLLLTTTIGFAQVGMVQSFQKISPTAGGFLGSLEQGDGWGYALTFIGDIDGDNIPDLAIGAPGDNDGGPARGAVWVLFLHPNGTVKSYQKISSTVGGFTGTLEVGNLFGYSVEAVGDLDGDGTLDLAVGAPGDNDGGFDRGAIWILHLHPNGTVKTHQKISDEAGEFTGELEDDDVFGLSVAAVGDLNGDGTPDLAVGAPLDDDGGSAKGAIWVLFMDPTGVVMSHQKISATTGGFTGNLDDGVRFGWSMEAVGDLDSDGIVDLAVGGPL